ncbi:GNAT family N-acetyltransferase, partial [bacterium]|nr:GNAT family N-acetyltransferase [bacterium]
AFLPNNNAKDVIDYADRFLNAENFTLQLSNPLYFTFGVFLQDRLIGYIQMYLNREEVYVGIDLELKRFYLLEEFHGKGYAEIMMKACEQQARKLGYSKFWLGVWEKNFKALRFYQKQGFEKISAHDFVMGSETQTDFILMKTI